MGTQCELFPNAYRIVSIPSWQASSSHLLRIYTKWEIPYMKSFVNWEGLHTCLLLVPSLLIYLPGPSFSPYTTAPKCIVKISSFAHCSHSTENQNTFVIILTAALWSQLSLSSLTDEERGAGRWEGEEAWLSFPRVCTIYHVDGSGHSRFWLVGNGMTDQMRGPLSLAVSSRACFRLTQARCISGCFLLLPCSGLMSSALLWSPRAVTEFSSRSQIQSIMK